MPRAADRVFTRGFLLVSLATLTGNAGYLVVFVALPLLLLGLGFGPAVVGTVNAGSSLVTFAARFPAGTAVDRWGARPFMVLGGLLLVGAAGSYAGIGSGGPVLPLGGAAIPVLLLAATVLQGLGYGIFTTAASAYVAYTVPAARRAEAVGYYGVLPTVAFAASAAFSLLILGSLGFSVVLVIEAAMALVAVAASLALVEGPPPARGAARPAVLPGRGVLGTSAVSAALGASYGVAFSFVALLGTERGIANPALFFTSFALTSMLVRVATGRFADRWGRLTWVTGGLLVASAGLLVAAAATGLGVLALAGVVYGVGSAIAAPTLQALVIDLAPPHARGSAMGTFNAMLNLGVSAGAVSAGALAPAAGYGAVFVGAAAMPLAGLAALRLSHRGTPP